MESWFQITDADDLQVHDTGSGLEYRGFSENYYHPTFSDEIDSTFKRYILRRPAQRMLMTFLKKYSFTFYQGNILIDEEQTPRISGFGLACIIEKVQPGLTYMQRLSNTNNPGSARWAAPERLSGNKPHPLGDMYSFGCIMYEVRTFPDALNGYYPNFSARCCPAMCHGRNRRTSR
jgi:serine/threonine protein kinase